MIPFTFKKAPGGFLRMERRRKGLSQKQLADMIGCSAQAISQYERNERDISFEVAAKISTALEYDFISALGLANYPVEASTHTEIEVQTRIVMYMQMLNEEGLYELEKRVHEMTQLIQYQK